MMTSTLLMARAAGARRTELDLEAHARLAGRLTRIARRIGLGR